MASGQIAPYRSPERDKLLHEETVHLLHDLEAIRAALATTIDPIDRQVFNSIAFKVPDGYSDDFINCYAGEVDGKRVVLVGLGFARAVAMYIDAQLLARRLGNPSLEDRYTDYIREKWQENLRRSQRGQDPIVPESPYEYLHASPDIIKEITSDSNKLYSAALTFAVAHEIGHHVLGHNIHTRLHPLDREKAADEWAMRAMVKAGQPPAAALLVVAFYASFFAVDADHPRPEERSIALIQQTLENWDALAASARSKGVPVDSYKRQLTAVLRQLSNKNSSSSDNLSAQDDDAFQQGLEEILKNIRTGFRNVIGNVERQRTSSIGSSVVYSSTVMLPMFDRCRVTFKDFRPGSETEYTCEAAVGQRSRAQQIFNALRPEMQVLTERGWRVTDNDRSRWRAVNTGDAGERLSISLDFFDDRDPDLIFTSLSIRVRSG
jgi:hypothetical protein